MKFVLPRLDASLSPTPPSPPYSLLSIVFFTTSDPHTSGTHEERLERKGLQSGGINTQKNYLTTVMPLHITITTGYVLLSHENIMNEEQMIDGLKREKERGGGFASAEALVNVNNAWYHNRMEGDGCGLGVFWVGLRKNSAI